MLPRSLVLAFLAACQSVPLAEAPPDPEGRFPVDYEEAADSAEVPAELLLALSYAETRLQMVAGEEEFPGQEPAYGVMALRGDDLLLGAELAGLDPEVVKTNRDANVLAAAHLLSAWAEEEGIDRADLGAWAPLAVRFGRVQGEAAAEYVHYEVYDALRKGFAVEGFELQPHDVQPAWPAPERKQTVRARDPGAVWTPSPNKSSRGGASVDFVVIHTCEGSYSGCWGWLTNSASGVSAHYVVNNTGSEVRQLVDENDKAWHISANYDCDNNHQLDCWRDGTAMNSISVGIEHAGYGSQSSWDPGLIQRSAELSCAITQRLGIPRDSYHIVGHGQLQPWNRTDPGAAWPWSDYLSQVGGACGDGGAPPAPNPGGGSGSGSGSGSPSPGGTDLVIDSNNGANDPSRAYVEVSSEWWASANVSGYWNTGYWVAPTYSVSDPASFWFHEASDVCYKVEAWWTSGSDRASSVAFLGWTEDDVEVGRATVDQTANGSRWNLLGHWRFEPGWNRVLLSRWASAGDYAVADAVRLTPSSSCP